jgi:hypothetical protein
VGDEKKQGSDQQHTDERDEMEDLDVAQQQAEDVKGGARLPPGVRRKLDP